MPSRSLCVIAIFKPFNVVATSGTIFDQGLITFDSFLSTDRDVIVNSSLLKADQLTRIYWMHLSGRTSTQGTFAQVTGIQCTSECSCPVGLAITSLQTSTGNNDTLTANVVYEVPAEISLSMVSTRSEVSWSGFQLDQLMQLCYYFHAWYLNILL